MLQDVLLKSTKFDFGWDSDPDSAGELTALPRSHSCEKERGRGY